MPKHVLWFLLLAAATGRAGAAQLDVTIEGVRDTRGDIMVAICSRAAFLQPHCAYDAKAPAQVGEVHLTLTGIPPGVYAAQAFHDANRNGVLDRNWLGIPEEGLGFSNDAAFHFGPPRFDVASFQLSEPGGHITFRIRYFDPPAT